MKAGHWLSAIMACPLESATRNKDSGEVQRPVQIVQRGRVRNRNLAQGNSASRQRLSPASRWNRAFPCASGSLSSSPP